MRYDDHFDAYDTNAGKYGSHKVPKWRGNPQAMIDYVTSQPEEEEA